MHLVEHLRAALTGVQAAWVMWLMTGLAAVSLVLICERLLFFRSIADDIGALASQVDRLLQQGSYPQALTALQASPSVAAATAAAGLSHADLGPLAAEKAMTGALALQRGRLERGLAFLGTLGNNAPFVGLLGTVIGVIEAFEALGASSAPAPTGGLASQAIMGGISEALVATAVGLFVAIPAVAAYNYFQRRIAQILASTEVLTHVLLTHLYAETPDPNP